MTLNMHLHNSSTSSQLPVMPLYHLKKQQKTAWRKLSDVLRAFSDRLFNELLCFMLNRSSQLEYGASHNRLKPLVIHLLPVQFIKPAPPRITLQYCGQSQIFYYYYYYFNNPPPSPSQYTISCLLTQEA